MPAEVPQPPEPSSASSDDDLTQFLATGESAQTTPHPDTPGEDLPLTVDLPAASTPANGDVPWITLPDALRGTAHGAPTPTVRRSVPGYEILEEIGRGGMGVVYKARQQDLDRLVALKMILAGAHAGPADRQRFRREAHAVASLQHPNIVQIFDVGEVDGCPYLAFEFVEGGSLASRLEGNPWPARDAATLVGTLARAVQFAHAKGVVHRDLKPANVLLADPHSPAVIRNSRSATPKITDFGLAKRVEPDSSWHDESGPTAHGQTRTGAVMGTPSYIAPEQAAGKNRNVGPPADVYALGAVLYELLTGRPPFRGETPLDTVFQVMRDDPIPPSRLRPRVPKDLETICLKCLQKQPARRYPSAVELANDLQHFLDGRPILARPTGYLERLVKWAQRHPSAATWGIFTGIVVLALLGVSIYFNVELQQAAEREEQKAIIATLAQKAAQGQQREAEKHQQIAQEERRKAEREREAADAERHKTERAHDEVRRGAYALLLAQSAALAERDPRRGLELLDQNKRCPPDLRDFTWRYLRRACDRQEQLWHDADGPVSATAFSPDGALLAGATWDRTVRIYDARSFTLRAILEGHEGPVLAVAFATDSCCLATAGDDHTVRLWDLPGSLRLPVRRAGVAILNPWVTLPADNGAARAVAFSPDGRSLATGGDDGLVKLWELPAPRRAVGAVAGGAMYRFAPVGSVRVPESIALKGHTRGIRTLSFCPSLSDPELASGGEDRTVRIWKLAPGQHDGRLMHTFPDAVNCIAWSPDTVTLAVATNSQDDPSIWLWDKDEGIETGRLRGHTKTVYSLAFGAEGKLLASGGSDRVVRLWDVKDQEEQTLFRGHEESVRAIAFSPDRRHLLSGGLDRSLRLWSTAPPREETFPLESEVAVQTAARSADGRLLAIGDQNGLIKVWQLGPTGPLTSARPLLLKGHTDLVSALVFTADGQALASAGRDGTIRVWKSTAGFAPGATVTQEHRFPRQGLVRGLVFSADDKLLIAGGDAGLRVLDWRGGSQRALPVRGGRARAIALAPDGRHLASASGTFLEIWDLQTSRLVLHSTLALSPVREVTTLAFEPITVGARGLHWVLATADDAGLAMLWDIHLPEGDHGPLTLAPRVQLPGHGERVEAFAFSPDGKTVVTASRDRTLRLWDPVAGLERATLNGHLGPVLLAAFQPGGSALFSVGGDGLAKVWPGATARK